MALEKKQHSSLPDDAVVTGNTRLKSRDPKSKRWTFVWNNYPPTAGVAVKNFSGDRRARCWIYGKEIGDQGTRHLQGYVEFKSDRRLSTLSKLAHGHIHWERAHQSKEINADYCAKDGDWYSMGAIEPAEKLDDPFDHLDPHQWQLDIRDICLKQCVPHTREIYWLVGADGAEGKTSWAKHMVIKHPEHVLYVSGKAQDMKFAIASRLKDGKRAPKIIILGIPRARSPMAVSYAGLEELKDGLFFSSKYESRMIVYNTPHVVVLANANPADGKFSEDRLQVWDLNFLMALEKYNHEQLEKKEEMILANTRMMSSQIRNLHTLRNECVETRVLDDFRMEESIPPLLTRSDAMQEPELIDRLRHAEALAKKRLQLEQKEELPPWDEMTLD